MLQSEIIFYIIKLILGGIAAFLAIMLWNKTRDSAWMSLVAGAITGYAGTVFDLLIKIGLVGNFDITVFGLPIITLVFSFVPTLFFILAFILILIRTR